MAYALSPYRKNTPRWAKVLVIVLLGIGQYLISGLNSDIGPRVTSYFGLDSSRVSFFLHISTVGLIVMFPLAYRFRAFFRRISLLLWAMGLQLLISLLCVFTYNQSLLLISSLLMGALKIVCILDFLALCIGLFPSMRDRGLLYGIFYAFSHIMRQISTFISLKLIENYNWESIFILSAIVAGLSILLCLIFFHPDRMQRKVPLYQIDWWSVLLICISGITMCYTLVMGKELNWLASPSIVINALVFLFATLLFIWRQLNLKRPYWNLRVFKTYRQVPLGFALMVMLFFFHTTSMLYNIYIDYNFQGEEHYLAHITFIQVITYLICFPLAGYLFHKGYSKRLLFGIGFLCYAGSLLYFSSIIQTDLTYWDLVPPLVLSSMAYPFTLVTAAAFMSTNISRKDNKDRAMGSIYARYILGSFVFYALFSNWVFRDTAQRVTTLASKITPTNLNFTQHFHAMTAAFSSRTTDVHQAQERALALIGQQAHVQALLITLRDITFFTGALAIVVTLIILCIRKLEMHNKKGKNHYRIVPW